MNWRPLIGDDMRSVYRIADEIYPPHLFETNEALLARVNMGGGFCHVLIEGREIFGYVIAHPWDLTVPKLGLGTSYPKTGFRTVFLHDLAILTRQRGQGFGSEAVRQVQETAAKALGSLRLVSVNVSVPFWASHGFLAVEDASKGLASYGRGAVLMEWRP